MPKLFNHANTRKNRQRLRNDMPEPERRLWLHLRTRNLRGKKFRRQHSIGPYIVDFYCPANKLVIEIDGDSHGDPVAEMQDAKRDHFLNANGIKVLRFKNSDVCTNIEAVIVEIMSALHIDPS